MVGAIIVSIKVHSVVIPLVHIYKLSESSE